MSKYQVTDVKFEILKSWDDMPDTSYLEQEDFEDRLALFQAGDFTFVGIQARATVTVQHPTLPSKSYTVHEFVTPGLWGIESDSGDGYFAEVALEEFNTLRGILTAFSGITSGMIDEGISHACLHNNA